MIYYFLLLWISFLVPCHDLNCGSDCVKATGLNRSKVTLYYNIGSLSIVQPRELSRSQTRNLNRDRALGATEINWQAEKNGCQVELKLSDETINVLSPLSIELTLSYPQHYTVDDQSLIDYLTQNVNILHSNFYLQDYSKTTKKFNDKFVDKISLQLYFNSIGTFFISFFNVKFISTLTEMPDVVVNMPVTKIEVKESLNNLDSAPDPLMNLEPKLPLSLTFENEANLFSKANLKLEEARNTNVIDEHSFPWFIIFLSLVVALVIYFLFNNRDKLLQNFFRRENPSFSKNIKMELYVLKNNLGEKNLRDSYLELSKILRKYLENRFNIPTSNISEIELHSFLAKLPYSDEIKNEMEFFFKNSFYVKFANKSLKDNDFEKFFDLILKIVNTN